jgi:hypothetical protein
MATQKAPSNVGAPQLQNVPNERSTLGKQLIMGLQVTLEQPMETSTSPQQF